VNNWKERFGGAALITGASSGIGAAFARALAARGMDLVLVARRKDRLDSLARELESAHAIQATTVEADLSKADASATVRRAVVEKGISIGLLVNNAGFGVAGSFENQDPEKVIDMVDVNCRAPAALARAFAPAMATRGKGGIIFLASTAAYQPTPLMAIYSATKAFDLFFGEALWAELEPKGIDVLALSPGYTTTEFQAVGGGEMKPPGGTATPEEVVETALGALGRRASVIHGFRNSLLAGMARVLPRGFIARAGYQFMRSSLRTSPKTAVPAVRPPPRGEHAEFQRAVARMIVTFLAVAVIDLVVGSLLTRKLRFWFPAWLDANWATRSDPWVTYSQSYLAGVFFIPFLALAASREFVPRAAASIRAAIALITAAVLAFILWWKGGLMVEHHKELEAVGWLALTATVWGLLRVGEVLPRWVTSTSPRQFATGVAGGVATFFLVMSVADPVLQLAVQHLAWSSGLSIEVGFFVPAGLILAAVAWRLRSNQGSQAASKPLPSRGDGG
jgi:uncharacterized protein